MPVINNEARIYHSWVNGNEHFSYEGDVAALNATLVDFAAVKLDEKRVVFRPEPGIAHSFHGMEMDMQWELHLVGGIAAHMTTLDKGDLIWSKAPVLTVFVGKEIDIHKVVIPKGVTVMGVNDLKKQYATAVTKSSDQTVRGWGCGNLASLDPYDAESLKVIAARLGDKESWVQLNAAGAVAVFGAKAKSELKTLKELTNSTDAGLKQRAEETIAKIEAAAANAEAERKHAELLEQIDKVVAIHRQKAK
jgi:hypothetical protein